MMAGDLIKVVWITIGLALAATFISWLAVKPAQGSPVCLTKAEARALWPRQHLYWYGPNHCWSNRRGKPHNLRYDLIKETHAESLPATNADKADRAESPSQSPGTVRIASASNEEKKSDPEPWPPAAKAIRIIEIIRPSIPLPVASVEAEELPPVKIDRKPANWLGWLAFVAGGIAAMIVYFFGPTNERIASYVKSGIAGMHRGITKAGSKVAAHGHATRNLKPPLPNRGIREIIRRVDRRRYDDHLAKILAHCENSDPCDEYQPPDHSPIAYWSRSIRAQENS